MLLDEEKYVNEVKVKKKTNLGDKKKEEKKTNHVLTGGITKLQKLRKLANLVFKTSVREFPNKTRLGL